MSLHPSVMKEFGCHCICHIEGTTPDCPQCADGWWAMNNSGILDGPDELWEATVHGELNRAEPVDDGLQDS